MRVKRKTFYRNANESGFKLLEHPPKGRHWAKLRKYASNHESEVERRGGMQNLVKIVNAEIHQKVNTQTQTHREKSRSREAQETTQRKKGKLQDEISIHHDRNRPTISFVQKK